MTEPVTVSSTVTERTGPFYVRGLDGKRYLGTPLSADRRVYLIGRAHYLKSQNGLSIREICKQIESETGIRRSVGTVAGYLKYRCTNCSGASSIREVDCSGGSNAHT